MTQPTEYICANCGKEHEEWPALTPFVDDYYNGITKAEAERRIQVMLQQVGEK